MALKLSRISFTRTAMPLLAVLSIGAAGLMIATSQPDRSAVDPVTEPPRAAPAFGDLSVVAGSGVVEPSSEIIAIAPNLPGVVTRILVAPGDQVAAGAPLFLVDDRQARADLAEAEAAILTARAAIAEARTQLGTARRQRALYDRIAESEAVARREVIDSTGAVEAAAARLGVAESDLVAATARRDSAATALRRLLVTAPVSGEILRVSVRPGEYVNAGGPEPTDPYMEMGTTRPLHVRIDVDEELIGRVRQGAPAIVSPRGNAGRRAQAQWVRAEPLVVPKRSLTNSAAERVDVRVRQFIYALPDGPHGLAVGQQVDAYLPASPPPRLATEGARATAAP